MTRRASSHSFTGVISNDNDEHILENDSYDKITRRKISEIYTTMRKRERPCLRKLSLMSMKYHGDSLNPKSLLKLQRSNSLPDRKALEKLETNLIIKNESKRGMLVKTRSVTFHLETICLNAAADNDMDELKSILTDHNIDINYKNGCGMSIIHHAAASGSFECVSATNRLWR